VINKQLLKCGTVIWALIYEAEFAQSKADFVNKMSIALKEANETKYWLSILKDSSNVDIKTFERINCHAYFIIKNFQKIMSNHAKC
jgi:four helix bundle protein